MEPRCKGKRFGHNFPLRGGDCLECGVSQWELSGIKLKQAFGEALTPTPDEEEKKQEEK